MSLNFAMVALCRFEYSYSLCLISGQVQAYSSQKLQLSKLENIIFDEEFVQKFWNSL
jgi:hypothetical protein